MVNNGKRQQIITNDSPNRAQKRFIWQWVIFDDIERYTPDEPILAEDVISRPKSPLRLQTMSPIDNVITRVNGSPLGKWASPHKHSEAIFKRAKILERKEKKQLQELRFRTETVSTLMKKTNQPTSGRRASVADAKDYVFETKGYIQKKRERFEKIRESIQRLISQRKIDPPKSHGRKFDFEFYTDDSEKRDRLRSNMQIDNRLDDWFDATTKIKNNSAHISKASYTSLMTAIYTVLMPASEGKTLEDAKRSAEQDWKRDCRSQIHMSEMEFKVAIFELADLWCETDDAAEYCLFLDTLFSKVYLDPTLPKVIGRHINEEFVKLYTFRKRIEINSMARSTSPSSVKKDFSRTNSPAPTKPLQFEKSEYNEDEFREILLDVLKRETMSLMMYLLNQEDSYTLEKTIFDRLMHRILRGYHVNKKVELFELMNQKKIPEHYQSIMHRLNKLNAKQFLEVMEAVAKKNQYMESDEKELGKTPRRRNSIKMIMGKGRKNSDWSSWQQMVSVGNELGVVHPDSENPSIQEKISDALQDNALESNRSSEFIFQDPNRDGTTDRQKSRVSSPILSPREQRLKAAIDEISLFSDEDLDSVDSDTLSEVCQPDKVSELFGTESDVSEISQRSHRKKPKEFRVSRKLCRNPFNPVVKKPRRRSSWIPSSDDSSKLSRKKRKSKKPKPKPEILRLQLSELNNPKNRSNEVRSSPKSEFSFQFTPSHDLVNSVKKISLKQQDMEVPPHTPEGRQKTKVSHLSDHEKIFQK